MRITVIGPVGKSESQLDRALDLSFTSLEADRAVYLGEPELVTRRRRPSVPPGGEESLWSRSLRCVDADPEAIERFVAAERRKLDWARLELLPGSGGLCIALSESRTLVACVEADETRPEVTQACVVVSRLGRAEGETFELCDAGGRCLLSPGTLDHAGVVLVSDEMNLSVEFYDLRGRQLERHVVESKNGAPSCS